MDGAEQHQHLPGRPSPAPSVLLTGATGFVGSFLAASLRAACSVRTAGRSVPAGGYAHVTVAAFGRESDWRRALDGIDAVVHCAGPAHAKHGEAELRRAIVDASAALAAQAARAGVRRFVYVSSIRACVSVTHGAAVSEEEPARPDDAYGRAKLEAEKAILAEATIQPIALRPPLVIGPGAKGNLGALLRALDTPLPLPFAGIDNKRNVISLPSLAEAVRLALEPANPATGVFHAADQPALSTPQMAALLREGMGRPRRLFAAPAFKALAPRPLVQSLEVDDSRLRATFGYRGQDAREALVACGRAWARR